MSSRYQIVFLAVLMSAVLGACKAAAQPEQFGLPEKLTTLTVLGDIAQRTDLGPFEYTEILVTWLIREYRDPSPTRKGLGGPVDSGWILSNLIDALYVKGDGLTIGEIAADPHSEPAVRDAMCIVLGMKGDSSQVPRLISILQNASLPYWRARAAGALGTLGATEAVPALEKALEDEYVVEIWPDVGPPEENNQFYPVRQRATESLRMLRDPELVSAAHKRSKAFAEGLKRSGEALVDLSPYLRTRGWDTASQQRDHSGFVAVNSKSGLRVEIGNGQAAMNGKKIVLCPAPVLRGTEVLVPRSFGIMLAYQSAPLSRLARAPSRVL